MAHAALPEHRMNVENGTMGEMVDKAKAAANKLAGSIKDGVGEMTDNSKLQSEGKAQKAKGTAQDVSGTVKGKLGNDV